MNFFSSEDTKIADHVSIPVWIVHYNDDIDQQLHFHCFYKISCLFPITTIDK